MIRIELYKDILSKAFSEHEITVHFENLTMANPNEIVESACYQAIEGIRRILDDDQLNDFECIERIVCLLEQLGTTGGSRHDFG